MESYDAELSYSIIGMSDDLEEIRDKIEELLKDYDVEVEEL